MVEPSRRQLRFVLTGLVGLVFACLLWLFTSRDQGRAADIMQATLALVGSVSTFGIWILRQESLRPAPEVGPSVGPVIWQNVPQRSRDFTGREGLLADLRRQLTESTVTGPHVLHGMGGVGKTQLVIEYAHRYVAEYQVVWWIPAEQVALVRSSLAALGRRLGIEDTATNRLEDAVGATLDALRRGAPFEGWLVVFDNADQPDEIGDLLPSGAGHVIVTSRNNRWEALGTILEIDVFSREDSLEFLRRRLPGIAERDADRLADELGDLPLALEQAAAFQIESRLTVLDYLGLFARHSGTLLGENPPAGYPLPLAAVWRLSDSRLEEQMPFARELLRRCALFGSAPIDRDVFKSGRHVVGEPLRSNLADPITLNRAMREIGRYALARVDNHSGTVQVHPLIQKLIREDMKPGELETARRDVHLLLAAADPGTPDDPVTWGRYEVLLGYTSPSDVVGSDEPEVRRFVQNVVRYLFNLGDLPTCDALSREALDRWTATSGPEDIDVLVLGGQRASLLWTLGAYQDAFEVRTEILERMRRILGEGHEATLSVANGFGADLRGRGQFGAALEHDLVTLAQYRSIFGHDDPRTFMMSNNVALDHALNSDYGAAYEMDLDTYRNRRDVYGRQEHPSVIHSLTATGHDLRQAGRYPEALAIEERAFDAFAALVRERQLAPDHLWVLLQAKDLAIARRKMGLLDTALELSTEVHRRFVRTFGAKHPDAVAARMSLGNVWRARGLASGDRELLDRSDAHLAAAWALYREVYGDDHPLTHGCAINVAILRGQLGAAAEAQDILEQASAALERRLGPDHHYTLTCLVALATVLAGAGDVEQAEHRGERALVALRERIGDDHPHTLACAVNLAIDRQASGSVGPGRDLAAAALERYRRVLPTDHPDVDAATRGTRIVIDFEPPHL